MTGNSYMAHSLAPTQVAYSVNKTVQPGIQPGATQLKLWLSYNCLRQAMRQVHWQITIKKSVPTYYFGFWLTI